MRPIRFRAWDKKGKRMGFWDIRYPSTTDSQLELTDEEDYYSFTERPEQLELMQFTGLLDKNGKEIWESDKVMVRNQYETDEPIECEAIVSYREGSFRLDFHDMILTEKVCKGEGNWSVEVIGNIYENPELISNQ